MRTIRLTSLIFLFSAFAPFLLAQNPIRNLTMRLDTSSYSWPADNVNYQERMVLPIVIKPQAEPFELQIIPRNIEGIKRLVFLPQSDFSPLDSLQVFQNEYFQGKIRLNNAQKPGVKNLAFKLITSNGDSINILYPILPTVASNISIPPKKYLLLVGEVSSIPLLTNFPENIKAFNTWKRNSQYAYRISRREGQNFLEIIPFESGEFEVRLNIECNFPHLSVKNSRISYYQRLDLFSFESKRGSLKFLDLELDDLFLGREEKTLTQIISFQRPLELDVKKNYRLEVGEEAGSRLVAEIFTQKLVSGGQIQGKLTVYDYHNREDGALFVKNSGKSIFQTNVNIIPKARIETILLDKKPREQKFWEAFPGESITLSWVGESLDRANWSVKGGKNQLDMKKIELTSEKAKFEVLVPQNIDDRQMNLLMNGKPTSYVLKVKEWNRPQKLSYISLGFPERKSRMYGHKMIKRPYYFDQLEDTDLSTHSAEIEKEGQLFGPQHLNIDLTLTDPYGRVLEEKKFEHVTIRPGKHSPRYKFYRSNSWGDTTLKLEKIFDYPIAEAPAWSKVQIDIAHDTARYDTGLEKIQFNIILRQKFQFNIELGIPVGVISNHPDHVDGTQIDGASIFLMGQVGLYQPNKVNSLQKFRLGAGIVALNAINFRRSNRVDLGVASMLHLYPTSKNSKLSVPLYVGGGYAITRNYWFLYAGAGLAVRLN